MYTFGQRNRRSVDVVVGAAEYLHRGYVVVVVVVAQVIIVNRRRHRCAVTAVSAVAIVYHRGIVRVQSPEIFQILAVEFVVADVHLR